MTNELKAAIERYRGRSSATDAADWLHQRRDDAYKLANAYIADLDRREAERVEREKAIDWGGSWLKSIGGLEIDCPKNGPCRKAYSFGRGKVAYCPHYHGDFRGCVLVYNMPEGEKNRGQFLDLLSALRIEVKAK